MVYVLGMTKVSGHQYTDKDIKAVVPLGNYVDNPTGFYGGRFKWAGETDIEGLIMLMDNRGGAWEVHDIAITDWHILGVRDLRDVAERMKYMSITPLNKEELIHLIETGEYPRKDKS